MLDDCQSITSVKMVGRHRKQRCFFCVGPRDIALEQLRSGFEDPRITYAAPRDRGSVTVRVWQRVHDRMVYRCDWSQQVEFEKDQYQ